MICGSMNNTINAVLVLANLVLVLASLIEGHSDVSIQLPVENQHYAFGEEIVIVLAFPEHIAGIFFAKLTKVYGQFRNVSLLQMSSYH